ncbi:hypothetical protein CVT24_009645 [Panaeolus cyanescens]|uniref:Uncharacterized protein n=1 Tax=Panaeolus cyanescens TaxID=181874 RepID=A0A409Y9X3_9AGAR|nr:hypothetical protein CVT24_009645 [Panaeolus cyanescens]
MPLSFLVHTSRLTTTHIIRPCASKGACSHGYKADVGVGRGYNTLATRRAAQGRGYQAGRGDKSFSTTHKGAGRGYKTLTTTTTTTKHLGSAHTCELVKMKMLARFFSLKGVGVVGGVMASASTGASGGVGGGLVKCSTAAAAANTINTSKTTTTMINTGKTTTTMRHHSSCSTSKAFAPEIEELFHGNEKFMDTIHKTNPGLLASLAVNGQREFLSSSYPFSFSPLFFSFPFLAFLHYPSLPSPPLPSPHSYHTLSKPDITSSC